MDRIQDISESSENDYGSPVPVARSLGEFASERVGDDLVLFDGTTMQYHTLNGCAQRIWQACDGSASIESIAAALELPVEVVATTVGELGEASLLTTPAESWSIPISRRRAAKLIAAGAIGLPVVMSITAPHSASAATCPGQGQCWCCEVLNPDNCACKGSGGCKNGYVCVP